MRQEKNFSSFENGELLKKFPTQKTPKERKQIKWAIFITFVLAILFILPSLAYRELPNLWAKINQPQKVVEEKFAVQPTAIPTPRFETEKNAVSEMLNPLRGTYGIYFQDLNSSDHFDIKGDEKFTAASLIKLPVLLTLYRESEAGRIDLDTIYTLQAVDRRGGAGALQYKANGFQISYRKLAEAMGQQSDNTAFAAMARILGDDKIQSTIDSLGMKDTSYADNITSPNDIGLFFRKLYKEKIVTDTSRDEILGFLTNTIWEDRIPAGIPKGIEVSHKVGSEIGVVSDAGIVFSPKPFILVIMSQEANEIEAGKALPEITKKIYEMYEE